MPQVLAVNILGRFLLNNDRNIRLVLLSAPLGSFLSTFLLHSLSLSPPHPSLPSLLSLWVVLPFHIGQRQNSLQSERERVNLPTGCYQPELTNHFPKSQSSRATPEGHCLSGNADLLILDLVIFHQEVWRPVTGSPGFCYVTIFWVCLHRGGVARQACLDCNWRAPEPHCGCVTVMGLVYSCEPCQAR